MAIQTTQSQTENNAILINKGILQTVRSALTSQMRSFDKLPSDREIIDHIVSQTVPLLNNVGVYSTVQPKETYKYFGSEISRKVQMMDDLANKGRFVDACLLIYLYGAGAQNKWITTSRTIRPRRYSEGEKNSIAQAVAGMAPAKDVDAQFVPTTCGTPIA